MRTITRFAALIPFAWLAGCGEPAEQSAAAIEGKASAGRSARWDPLDACTTLGTASAAKVSGSDVRSAEITTRVEGRNGNAAFSMCTFELANGGRLTLLTRESPTADATPQAIESARTGGGMAAPAADVPNLGKAALWSEQTKGLQVFLDDTRYLSINVFNLPAGADARAIAIAAARELS